MDDANVLHGRSEMGRRLAEAARAVPVDDPKAMAIIRESRAQNQREAERFWMEEAEIVATLKTLDVDAILPLVQSVGFPPVHRAVNVGSYIKGTKDTPTFKMQRHEFDRWMERFDAVATRLGYVRKQTPPAELPRTSRAGATSAAVVTALLMAFGLLA
jgi:hypothetical protein